MWDWHGYKEAQKRERMRRWAAPSSARVTHPKYGSTEVPCQSGYAAVLNAAEVWGCDWVEIIDAKVEAIPKEETADTASAVSELKSNWR